MDSGLTVQWLGDISLNGPFCDPQHADALRKNLHSIATGLGICDLRVANWESPLWGDGTVNQLKVPRLATLPHAAKAMEPLRLDVALLANNHVYDCGEAGFDNTVEILQQMGTQTMGAGRSEKEASQPLILERRGMRLGLLNYVGAETRPNLPPTAGVSLNWFDEDRATSEISDLRAHTDAVFVHLHWGADGDAFLRLPSLEQRRIARRLVEAGANVVVGSHVHVLQGHEPWRDGYIFHGMGNFLFWPSRCALDPAGPWPPYVREVGVGSCRLTAASIQHATLRYLVQVGLALRWDETPRRRRIDRRLSSALRLSDKSLSRARRLEMLRKASQFRLHAVRQAGGLGSWLVAKSGRMITRRLPATDG